MPFLPMTSHTRDAMERTGMTGEELHWEIVLGLTRTFERLFKGPDYRRAAFFDDIRYEGISPLEAWRNLPPDVRVAFDQMNDAEKRRVLLLSGANFMWENGLTLTRNSDYHQRTWQTEFTDDARAHFPKLIRFIESLPFEKIGMAEILGTDPYQPVHWHVDGSFDMPATDSILVTFLPEGQRRDVLVKDRHGNVHRPPLDGFCIDDRYLHSIPAGPSFFYLIKIDGIFKPNVRQPKDPIGTRVTVS